MNTAKRKSRSSRRKVRIRAPFFSAVYFSIPKKKGERVLLGDLEVHVEDQNPLNELAGEYVVYVTNPRGDAIGGAPIRPTHGTGSLPEWISKTKNSAPLCFPRKWKLGKSSKQVQRCLKIGVRSFCGPKKYKVQELRE